MKADLEITIPVISSGQSPPETGSPLLKSKSKIVQVPESESLEYRWVVLIPNEVIDKEIRNDKPQIYSQVMIRPYNLLIMIQNK